MTFPATVIRCTMHKHETLPGWYLVDADKAFMVHSRCQDRDKAERNMRRDFAPDTLVITYA